MQVNPFANDRDAQTGTIIRVAQAAILCVMRNQQWEQDMSSEASYQAVSAWSVLVAAVNDWAESNPESAARLEREEHDGEA